MNLIGFLYLIILPAIAVSMILTFIRFLRGPSIADRIVAVDLMITIGVGIIAVYSIVTNQPTFLDIAMILALITFLGTVAYSYYLERRERND
jgi:multicomponent Na+:H+ antiporter subunit F